MGVLRRSSSMSKLSQPSSCTSSPSSSRNGRTAIRKRTRADKLEPRTLADTLEPPVAKRCTGVLGVSARSKMAARAALSAAGASSAGTLADIVGSAGETQREHKARHPQFHPGCSRCVYEQLHKGWEQGHGCHRHGASGNEVRTVWLAQRPAHLGGVWGLGCVFCAAYSLKHGGHARVKQLKLKRGSMGSSGRWSRYEVRALSQMGSQAVRQHADTFTHRLATRAFFVPDCA